MRNSPPIARVIQPNELGPSTASGYTARRPDRRRDPRWPYRVSQMVAFHDELAKPTKEMLRPVRCHDISLSGISFFLEGQPAGEHCTLVLGRPPGLTFVKARVVHSEPTEASPSTWIIGCEFVEKLPAFPLREE
jgi:hypothetical protein